ncbi:MAG TPA: PIN domain-containing protein [Thermoanaerobaculia bacterium]|nr:PIN domain-containing protein [Thermoanaerobaculia bacterium]
MKLLLDTNTLNYILKGREAAVDQLGAAIRRDSTFLLGSMVHYELTRYLRLKGAHRLMRLYENLVVDWRRCNLAFEDWDEATRLWEERHRLGKSISDMDLLLATLARKENAIVVTSNTSHFEGLGVSLQDWMAPANPNV